MGRTTLNDSANEINSTPIYTIGYGNNPIEEFINILKKYRIDYLIDVRSKPFSKFLPDYSRENLEKNTQLNPIRYVFMGDLLGGMPADETCYTDGRVDYAKCRKKDFFKAGIDRITTAFQKDLRVALMCSCGKPQNCHRSKLIGKSLILKGVDVLHLDDKGKQFTQNDIEILLSPISDLFGNEKESATSRKKYEPAKK